MTNRDDRLAPYRRQGELSHAERDHRWARVRDAMQREDIAVLVTPPNPGFWDQLQAHATYLSTVGGNNVPVSVVFPMEGEVTAIVGPVPSAGFWRAWQSWVTDVRETPWTLGDGVISRLREIDLDGRRIGVPGLAGSPRFPDGLATTGFIERITDAFPKARLVDATKLMDDLRAQKSAEERDAVQTAVGMAEGAFEVLMQQAKPGVPEQVLYGQMVGHLIELGSLPTNFLMWSAGNNFGHSLAPFPTGRPLTASDTIFCEIEARSPSGYLGQITRTLCMGTPEPRLQEMFNVAATTFENVIFNMRPGATIQDVLAVYGNNNSRSEYRAVPVIHARALGEDRPMIIFNTDDPAILNHQIRENHVYAVKVQVRDDARGDMAFFGESVAIDGESAVRLGKQPIEPAARG
jgi:Xaa-Pro dipeptidase